MTDGLIYGLAHGGEIRYVGQTCNLKQRMRSHVVHARRGKTHVHHWLRSIDYQPDVVILERDPVGGLDEAEKAWIATLRATGCRLTNLTDGGDGLGFGNTLARPLSASPPLRPASRPKSPEHRAAISATLSGRKRRPHSAETRARISAARKGKPCNHRDGCACSFYTDPARGARIRWGVS